MPMILLITVSNSLQMWLHRAALGPLLSSIPVSMLSVLLSSLFACTLMLQAADPEVIAIAATSDIAPIERQMRELAGSSAGPMRFVFESSGQLAYQIRAGRGVRRQPFGEYRIRGTTANPAHTPHGAAARQALQGLTE